MPKNEESQHLLLNSPRVQVLREQTESPISSPRFGNRTSSTLLGRLPPESENVKYADLLSSPDINEYSEVSLPSLGNIDEEDYSFTKQVKKIPLLDRYGLALTGLL